MFASILCQNEALLFRSSSIFSLSARLARSDSEEVELCVLSASCDFNVPLCGCSACGGSLAYALLAPSHGLSESLGTAGAARPETSHALVPLPSRDDLRAGSGFVYFDLGCSAST